MAEKIFVALRSWFTLSRGGDNPERRSIIVYARDTHNQNPSSWCPGQAHNRCKFSFVCEDNIDVRALGMCTVRA